ncbi:hypothetical protein PHYBLDRAFT_118989, partial [Phycomyces blakesleeanus NRRL 1555(-)]
VCMCVHLAIWVDFYVRKIYVDFVCAQINLCVSKCIYVCPSEFVCVQVNLCVSK